MNIQTITFFAIAFVTFIGFIIFRLRINFTKIQGKRGEKSVSKTLMQLPDEYIIFNNVYIQENGRYSQIDHIVLSPYGIFVIETKNTMGGFMVVKRLRTGHRTSMALNTNSIILYDKTTVMLNNYSLCLVILSSFSYQL